MIVELAVGVAGRVAVEMQENALSRRIVVGAEGNVRHRTVRQTMGLRRRGAEPQPIVERHIIEVDQRQIFVGRREAQGMPKIFAPKASMGRAASQLTRSLTKQVSDCLSRSHPK